jgi:hypothetical protein
MLWVKRLEGGKKSDALPTADSVRVQSHPLALSLQFSDLHPPFSSLPSLLRCDRCKCMGGWELGSGAENKLARRRRWARSGVPCCSLWPGAESPRPPQTGVWPVGDQGRGPLLPAARRRVTAPSTTGGAPASENLICRRSASTNSASSPGRSDSTTTGRRMSSASSLNDSAATVVWSPSHPPNPTDSGERRSAPRRASTMDSKAQTSIDLGGGAVLRENLSDVNFASSRQHATACGVVARCRRRGAGPPAPSDKWRRSPATGSSCGPR